MSSELPEFPNKWAVLVGINSYKHVPPLQFCKKDALDLGDRFRSVLGFEADNVLSLTEDSPKLEPTGANLYHILGQINEVHSVGEDDLLVFFFSGHGMIGNEDSKDYLLPIDATYYNLSRTGVPIEVVANELKRTGCKNIVMFIDACREPVSGTKAIMSLGDDAINAVKRAGIVTIFSCDPKYKSYEIDSLQHGAFTHCILEAINTGEGKTVASLYKFLKTQVPQINAAHSKPFQQPYGVIEPPEKGELPMFLSKAALTDLVTLLEQIGDLRREEKIDDEWTNKIVEFLTTTKPVISGPETGKIQLIQKLCTASLTFTSFKVVWESHERSRRAAPAKVQRLDPIQKLPPPEEPPNE
jgi:uncharacterized caspase-like protein